MVKECIVLGHKILKRGIDVDKAKIEVIEKLPTLIFVKGIKNFLRHKGFYKWFIKDFSKIANPLCKLFEKEVKFMFDNVCLKAFECLKEWLISTPIIMSLDWTLSFEVMCDASGVALGAILGKRRENIFHLIYYTSKATNPIKKNYIITK